MAECGGFLQRDRSGKPLLLVASPDLQGPYRATDVKLAALFPEHPPSAKVAQPVLQRVGNGHAPQRGFLSASL